MFKVVLRNSFWDIYDSIGMMALVSLIWFLPLFSFLFFSFHHAFIPSILSILFLGATTAGILEITYSRMIGKNPSIKDFLAGIEKGAHKVLVFWAIYFLIFVPVSFSIGFYLRRYQTWGVFSLLLSGIGFWLLAFLTMAQIYGLPLILQRGLGPLSTIRVATALVIRHFPYTLLLSSFALAVSSLLFISGIGFLFLEGAFLGSLFNNALCELLRKYDDEGLPPMERHKGRGIGELIRPWSF